jgi:phosphate transport system protein
MRVPHIVGAFDIDLQNLARRIAAMGGLAERMVGDAVAALVAGDPNLAQAVVARDEALDRGEREVDEAAVHLIGRRQPVAGDLDEVVGAIRIAADLERVGDLAKNIAKRVRAVGPAHQPPELVRGIQALTDAVLNQLKDVLDAYAARSGEALGPLRERDQEIDIVFTSLFREVLEHMTANPREISAAIHLLFCIKNIERIGDHAASIAATVHRIVTGSDLPAERAKGDATHSVIMKREGDRDRLPQAGE